MIEMQHWIGSSILTGICENAVCSHIGAEKILFEELFANIEL